ncbi:MarR family winged helix-turn-helix transcriptional regulator [Streptomyces sp. NPDC059917]|uniref:MarR family winged helix-turn-helix transcriptional regulator n=1 Tax=Streptomyces sp. NPDC059917 TaxID=3347002 RepID=UPI003648F2FC
MSQRQIRSARPSVATAHVAVAETSELIEMLAVIWERGRDTASAPPVSSAQARVLFLIDGNGEMNLRELGRLLEAAPPSVTRLCDRLQAVGFVERHPGTGDRREVLLALTPAGRSYLADLRGRRQEALAAAMAAMPPASRAALAVGLADFCAAVGSPLRLAHERTAPPRTA